MAGSCQTLPRRSACMHPIGGETVLRDEELRNQHDKVTWEEAEWGDGQAWA